MKLSLNDLKCVNHNIDLDEYIEFREYVKKHMEHPEWLGDFTRDDLEVMLSNGCKIWIYYLSDIPVCSMMFILSDENSIKKFGVNLDYREVIDYGPMMVSPEFVGNGLQYQMLKGLDDYSKNKGYNYAIGTIHPDNFYSINNLLKDDFYLHDQKEFKRGLRNIYVKKLIK